MYRYADEAPYLMWLLYCSLSEIFWVSVWVLRRGVKNGHCKYLRMDIFCVCHLLFIRYCLVLSPTAAARLTCGNFGKILLLLGRSAKQQDALEADGLVGTQCDAYAQVVAAHNLNQPGVLWTGERLANQSPVISLATSSCSQSGLRVYLRVGEAKTTQVRRHLQPEGTHLLQAIHGVILHFLQGIIFGGVVHFLKQTRAAAAESLECQGHTLLCRHRKEIFKLPQRIFQQGRQARGGTAPAHHSLLSTQTVDQKSPTSFLYSVLLQLRLWESLVPEG